MERDLKLDSIELCNIIDDFIGLQIDLVHGEYDHSLVDDEVDDAVSVCKTDRHRSIES